MNDQKLVGPRRFSNASIRYELTQQGIHARLPPWAAAAQVLHGLGVQADFYLDLRSVQLRPPSPRGLHLCQERRIHRRIFVVNIGVKLVHNSISLRAFPPVAD